MPASKRTATAQEIAQLALMYRDASLTRVKSGFPEAAEQNTLSGAPPDNSASFPKGVLSLTQNELVDETPETLLFALAYGNRSAVHVTAAFLTRAVLAQTLTNCITQLFPEVALSRAAQLDEYMEEYEEPIGPLHGLPISVKEMHGMKDIIDMNAGDEATEAPTPHVLRILLNAGAVLHAKTIMTHLETDNNLYGTTVNPHNRRVSLGGSSGGEGALIAMRGSCLGIASDLGGGIRSPAANCGIYGFKPTAFRIPSDGWYPTNAGADPIPGIIGPMSTSILGIQIFMKTIIDAEPWKSEPALISKPWSYHKLEDTEKVKIAIMWNDGVITPHPPIESALSQLVEQLKEIPNISLDIWDAYCHDEAWIITKSLYCTDDGAEDISRINVTDEALRPHTTRISKENPCPEVLSPEELGYWQKKREKYCSEYAKKWNDTATGKDSKGEPIGMVDVILCPTAPSVVPRHDKATYWGYTSQWNLLDYPAVVFPFAKITNIIVGAEDKEWEEEEGKGEDEGGEEENTADNEEEAQIEDEEDAEEFEPYSDMDTEHHNLYNPEEHEGLPISFQLVGRQFEDEKVISIMEFLSRKLNLRVL